MLTEGPASTNKTFWQTIVVVWHCHTNAVVLSAAALPFAFYKGLTYLPFEFYKGLTSLPFESCKGLTSLPFEFDKGLPGAAPRPSQPTTRRDEGAAHEVSCLPLAAAECDDVFCSAGACLRQGL